ncbi:hypothetical protein C4561_00350 [candidate division WWE3 bacterium]|jgi:hypothetical protein|uniref:Uncharacterized protein n=1 Tax=candidate division WWE3 bacterium TaxID=2053526 RepID=A0A3A4ZGC2_UNCKA|nr:MAG: hypothetical protein C4561_00350 [candidate division WWE3 bacterium]
MKRRVFSLPFTVFTIALLYHQSEVKPNTMKSEVLDMKLRELLAVIDSSITLEIADVKEKYDSKSALPQERMNYIVKSIKADNNSPLIILGEPKKVATLEELGYSFETGM